jgi:hypothetical protein
MITDIEQRSSIGPDLRTEKLELYWNEYWHYRDTAPELHSVVEEKLVAELDSVRSNPRPFLDSQQIISRILTELGPSANFHRQFGEQFPGFKPNQTLGMQLYALMASDTETWIYSPIQHAGHMHPHATYFKPGT